MVSVAANGRPLPLGLNALLFAEGTNQQPARLVTLSQIPNVAPGAIRAAAAGANLASFDFIPVFNGPNGQINSFVFVTYEGGRIFFVVSVMPVGIITFPFYLGLDKIKNPTVNDMMEAMNALRGPLFQGADSAYIRALNFDLDAPGFILVRIGGLIYRFATGSGGARGNPAVLRPVMPRFSSSGILEFGHLSNPPANEGPQAIEGPREVPQRVPEKIAPEDRTPRVGNPDQRIPLQEVTPPAKPSGVKDAREENVVTNISISVPAAPSSVESPEEHKNYSWLGYAGLAYIAWLLSQNKKRKEENARKAAAAEQPVANNFTSDQVGETPLAAESSVVPGDTNIIVPGSRAPPAAGWGRILLPIFFLAYLVFLHYAALPWLNAILIIQTNAIAPAALGLTFLGAHATLFNIGIYLSFFMGNAVVLLVALVFAYRQFGPTVISGANSTALFLRPKVNEVSRELKKRSADIEKTSALLPVAEWWSPTFTAPFATLFHSVDSSSKSALMY